MICLLITGNGPDNRAMDRAIDDAKGIKSVPVLEMKRCKTLSELLTSLVDTCIYVMDTRSIVIQMCPVALVHSLKSI